MFEILEHLLYFEGLPASYFKMQIVFWSLKSMLILASSADSGEMLRSEISHLSQYYLGLNARKPVFGGL